MSEVNGCSFQSLRMRIENRYLRAQPPANHLNSPQSSERSVLFTSPSQYAFASTAQRIRKVATKYNLLRPMAIEH